MIEELIKKKKSIAICCNENGLGKDWFILSLDHSFPYFREYPVKDEDLTFIKQLKKNGQLQIEHFCKYGTCYVLKGRSFRDIFKDHKRHRMVQRGIIT